MKLKIKKTINVLYWIALGFVLIVSFLSLFSSFTVPGRGYPKWLVVQSGSMSPAILPESLILIQQKADYKVGDVVSYITEKELGKRNPKNTTTHRIVEEKKDAQGRSEFITKGDANNVADSPSVKKGLISGKVLISLPLLGYVVGFTKTLPGLMILIIIPTTIIVYSEIINLKKAFTKFLAKRKVPKEYNSPLKDEN